MEVYTMYQANPIKPTDTIWAMATKVNSMMEPLVLAQEGGGTGKKVVDVTKYGAKGDGVTDDSEALLRAVAELPIKGGHLLFPPGVYLHGDGISDPVNGTGNSYPVDTNDPSAIKRPLMASDVNLGRNICMQFEGYEDLTVSGYGAMIISHPDNGEVKNNAIFEFNNCTNLVIEGFILNGNSHNRQPSLSDYDNGGGWNNRSNLSIGGGKNIRIKDVASLYSMMDGFAIGGNEGTPITELFLDNCFSDYAYRNGLTLSTCRNVKVTASRFTNTGVTYGTFPKIGADIEADWGGTLNEGIVIEDTYFEGNVVGGLAFAVGARNCHVNRCTFKGARQYPTFALDADRWGYNYVKDCHFIDTGLSTNLYGVYVEGNTFELFPQAGAGESVSMDFFHLQGDDVHPSACSYIRNNTFRVDLSGVHENAESVDVGRIWFGNIKNVVFENNVMINLYSAGSSIFYVLRWGDWSSTPEHSVKNNLLMFTEDRLLNSMNEDQIVLYNGATPSANYSSGNRAVGYPKLVRAGFDRSESKAIVTGHNYVKSELLDNGSLYKIDPVSLASSDPNLMTNLKITLSYLDTRTELEYTGNWSDTYRLTHYIENAPSIDVPTEYDFYNIDGSIYLDVRCYYSTIKVEVNFAGGNGYVYMDSSANPISEVEDDSILDGNTVIPYTFVGKKLDDLSSISTHEIDVGHCTFSTVLNKPIWWTGTEWVDSAGGSIS